jgi:large subunit ribosomal protein L22
MGLRKRQSAEKIKEAKKQVAFAKLNNCPTSPRKMRIVADSVRGKKVEMALTILKFSQKEASNKLEKLLMSGLFQIGKLKMKILMLKKQIYLLKKLE